MKAEIAASEGSMRASKYDGSCHSAASVTDFIVGSSSSESENAAFS